ncbi:glycoside hydrolase superfamily [Aspergillus caelatus]|uniref:Glycoside hydrolase superfamily n=1 Tax=Aspergillus caelatus TaxID=61420 RepID=A0A5N6ZN89_9EURO|nr:glycoside hydrolase superfamily [Aspergillus caelatus]KAE8358915.1 glycoside hydrolase superfamily [Aspergillus caelatus]
MKWLVCVLAVLLLSLQVKALPRESLDQSDPAPPSGEADYHKLPNNVDLNNLPPLLPIPDPATPDLVPSLPIEGGYGISYAPYNNDGTCRSVDRINEDLDKISTDYSYVRIYGVDCDQTKNIVSAARQRNLRVFAGLFDLQDFPSSLDQIISAAAGDWSIFHTISIGNELVNKGQNPQDVVNAVHTARAKLRTAGYQGPVVTVDTFSILLRHPQLCEASDYCAANCHAFFDANQTPDNAGKYALEQANRISAAAGGKRTVIAESGWPNRGQANGKAVPSAWNQAIALYALGYSFRDRKEDMVLFSAFDDLWKQDEPGTYGAEKFWGIMRR